MQSRGVGSILVGTPTRPEGILTDSDLRRAVADGVDMAQTSVAIYMTFGLRSETSEISAIQALHRMLQAGISHLGIVSKASNDDDVIGIVSQRDLLRLQDFSAAGILYHMHEASSPDQLKVCVQRSDQLIYDYLNRGIPYAQLAEMRTLLNDVISERIIEITLDSFDLPPGVYFCWMALGSMGRKEQLFPTDQDNAIIFSNVPDDELETTRNILLNLASQINSQLNDLGFDFCPAGMMAKNQQWCLSLSEWKQRFSNWIDQPDETSLLHSTIFFDFRRVWGDNNLVQSLNQHLREHLLPHPVFLNYLGIDALKNPKPLNLLSRLRLEPSGNHRGQFDLKGRLLMPYIDAARLLMLNSGMEDPKNTLARFQKLKSAEPQNESLYQNAHEAFEFLEGLRGTHRSNSYSANGRYVQVKNLTKRQRHTLRYAAKTLRELQTLLITRFQLSRFL